MKGKTEEGYPGTIVAVTIQDGVHSPHNVLCGCLLDCIVPESTLPTQVGNGSRCRILISYMIS